MKPGARWLLNLSMLAAGETGLVWGTARLWEPGPEPEDRAPLEWTGQHPWNAAAPDGLFAVPLLVFAVGLIWTSHVAPRLTRAGRAPDRLLLAALMAPMVVSGVALQTATSPESRELGSDPRDLLDALSSYWRPPARQRRPRG